MPNLTKAQGEMKSMFDDAPNKLNLMITYKIKSLDLIDNLIDFEIIIKEIEKINKNERLEDMIRKVLYEFKTEKTEVLKWKSRFLTLTNRSFKKLRDYEEEKEARKVTRKCIEQIDIFKIKIKGTKN